MLKSEVYNEVDIYFKEISRTPLLKRDEELELTRRIKRLSEELEKAEGKDCFRAKREYEDSVERLVEANLRLVVSIAKNYNYLGLDFLDLIGYGNIGLLKSIKKYNPDFGFKFATYATWWIKQSIRMALNDYSRTIRLRVSFLEYQRKVNKIRAKFVSQFEREPIIEELAERTKLNKKMIELILSTKNVTSLNQAYTKEDEDLEHSLEDKSNTEQPTLDNEKKECLKRILDELKPREAFVLKERYLSEDGKTRTLEKVGKKIGICRERVRQIERKAIRGLGGHPRRSRELQSLVDQ